MASPMLSHRDPIPIKPKSATSFLTFNLEKIHAFTVAIVSRRTHSHHYFGRTVCALTGGSRFARARPGVRA